MSEILEYADKLRSQIDIADVVGKYVQLRRTGANYKGQCPFHNEKTPSFTVSASKQIFHCFGCHAGGDAIRFIQKIERLEWIEAVRYLSREYGIAMPEMRRSPSETQETKDARASAMEVTALAARLFAENLQRAVGASHEIAEYLENRHLPPEIVKEFQLGLAPDAWTALLDKSLKSGYNNEALLNAGLVIKHHEKDRIYDRFRNRLMFPIHNTHGDPVAFGARVYAKSASPDEPKYINSPESLIYHKGQTLYALNIAKDHIVKAEKAILMEGYMDVIRAHSCGIRTAIATCGTALTDEQARTLKRYCSSVVFAYDGDDAGQKAMLRGTEILLEQGFNVHIMTLPDGHDPDSFLKQHGTAGFEQQVQSAQNFYQHFVNTATRTYDIRTPEGKVQAVELMLPLLRRIRQPIIKNDYTNKLADRLDISPLLIQRQLKTNAPASIDRLRKDVLLTSKDDQFEQIEKPLLKLLIERPSYASDFRQAISQDWFCNAATKKWFNICINMDKEELCWEAIINSPHIESDDEEVLLREIALQDNHFFDRMDVKIALQQVAKKLNISHEKKKIEILRLQLDSLFDSKDYYTSTFAALKIADESRTAIRQLVKTKKRSKIPKNR